MTKFQGFDTINFETDGVYVYKTTSSGSQQLPGSPVLFQTDKWLKFSVDHVTKEFTAELVDDAEGAEDIYLNTFSSILFGELQVGTVENEYGQKIWAASVIGTEDIRAGFVYEQTIHIESQYMYYKSKESHGVRTYFLASKFEKTFKEPTD